jgi:RHS repeat-associated protein
MLDQQHSFFQPPLMRPNLRSDFSYRYTYNGKELDKEGLGGGGATFDYGFRIYNAQIAKFLSVDPLFKSYPFYTPYQFASNSPILATDVDGLESDKEFQGGFVLKFLPTLSFGLYALYTTPKSNFALNITTYASDNNDPTINFGYTPNIYYDVNINKTDNILTANASLYNVSPKISISNNTGFSFEYQNKGIVNDKGIGLGFNIKTKQISIGLLDTKINSFTWSVQKNSLNKVEINLSSKTSSVPLMLRIQKAQENRLNAASEIKLTPNISTVLTLKSSDPCIRVKQEAQESKEKTNFDKNMKFNVTQDNSLFSSSIGSKLNDVIKLGAELLKTEASKVQTQNTQQQ